MKDTDNTREKQPLGLRILLWLIAFLIVGGAICIILGYLKWALQAVLIVGAILIVFGLILAVAYQSLRRKMHQARIDHEAAEEARRLEAEQQKQIEEKREE